MRWLGYVLAFLLGLPTGVAAVAEHQSPAGFALGIGTTLVVGWTLHLWLPGAATAFAVGWLVPLVVAVMGRPEGDVAVASDAYGWSLIVAGFVVLATGIAWGRSSAVQNGPKRDGPPP